MLLSTVWTYLALDVLCLLLDRRWTKTLADAFVPFLSLTLHPCQSEMQDLVQPDISALFQRRVT
jgi:hypothetical protein